MSKSVLLRKILDHVSAGGHLTLFLDYDGTLVPIAPTPDDALPDPQLLDLLGKLAHRPAVRVVIMSGRSLEVLRRILPVTGLLLAGLYGVEMQIDGAALIRGHIDEHRDNLAELKESWGTLIRPYPGFLLEDKGRALALHARWAEPEPAARVLAAAHDIAKGLMDPASQRLLFGNRYIEVAPKTADKGETVSWLLARYPFPDDLAVCFGDDNKDERAFESVQGLGGYAIGIGDRYPLAGVNERLSSPSEVRAWLADIAVA